MSKHTPGPWTTFNESAGYPGIEADGFTVVVFGKIDTDEEAGVQGRDREEALANARLIAAAPDLLAFAMKARDFARELDDDGMYAAADEVIAKAEGK